MENLPVNNHSGQSYGYTLYETLIGGSSGTLDAKNHVRDRALVRRGGKGAGVSHKHTVKSDTTHRRAAVTVALDKRLVSIFFSSTFSGFCGQTVCRCSGLRNTRVVSSRGEGKLNFDLLSLGDRKMLGR